ncbi:4-coumarate--CoA ligase [Oceanicola sp. 22II-s10i]|uniref:class I adenylate-forming enzyme family protein n=1 Tax=Oceanicola sp. 22II-s10i TaxID=1317116 RepID=UPI000B529142|nr:class I adenylate-forming enzyme family protein [Oceanicola sp. 22II-s10i]OWU86566.1 4-coumarate--CoA ligase [Oceanicola sp. 22II-s10i]
MSEGVRTHKGRIPPREPENRDLPRYSQMVMDAAKLQPQELAVICEETDTFWTWEQFADRISRIAGRLVQEGVGPDVIVCGLADNSPDYLALYAGVLHAGGCMAPLPFSATEESLVKMVDNSDPLLLFSAPKFMETAERLGAKRVISMADFDTWLGDAEPIPPVPVEPEHMFNVIYSSGTTGTPKGIVHDQMMRVRQMNRAQRNDMDEKCRHIMSTPLYSNTTLVTTLSAMTKGCGVVIMSRFNTKEFLRLSEKYKVTHAILVPVQYMRLMREPDFDKYDLSSYICKMSTSAPLPGVVIEEVMRRWPGNIKESYGMTEGGASFMLDCAANPTKWDTVGQLNPGCELKMLDEEGNEIPITEFGEIVGRGASMMPGYLKVPDKTEEATYVDADGKVWIRSGDMGRVDEDGFLHLLDRKKDMIISGGFNIYATDLEQVLRKHPDVADVAVIAVPSEDWGETPLALVVPKTPDADGEAMREWANGQLGKTQRISKIEFREDLPRSEIGKILKRELREPYWQTTPA